MSSVPTFQPVTGPAAWTGAEMSRRKDWIQELTPAEVAAVERMAADARRSGKSRADLGRDDVDLGVLAPTVAGWREALHRGAGFLLVRGLPVHRLSAADIETVYWLLGLHLGTPVPQNLAGQLLTDIRDTGADPADPSTRLYKTSAEQDFHTDGADVIGLLCLQGAKTGGRSRIVSSVAVHNELLRRRPDLVPVLFENFFWHYFEPPMPEPVYFVRPVCTRRGSGLNTSFIAWYIRRAQELDGVPPLTSEQDEAIAWMEKTANDPSLALDMEFRPGDIQWLKNSVILHKRTAYTDWPEPERRRHLLRLWLAAPDFEDGDEQLRGGIRLDAANG